MQSLPQPTAFIGDDARLPKLGDVDGFDLILTSPPYLNGTNYFRNTKLELWITGFLENEAELGKFTVDQTEKWAKVIRAASIKAE